jgi:methyl-accepting chemotaxis protein
MSRILGRIVGLALIIAGLAGLAFSIVGAVVVSRVEQEVRVAVTDTLDLTSRALSATGDGLAVAHTSIGGARFALASLVTTTRGFSKAMTDTLPALKAVSGLVGDELPATLEATEQTMRSVATNVKVVDQILPVLTQIPFLGLGQYVPDQPLAPSFEAMAGTLHPLPASLRNVRKTMDTATGNVASMSASINNVMGDIAAIGANLSDAALVIEQYQQVIGDLQARLAQARDNLPSWLSAVRLGVWLVLAWLGIAQLGLLTQGWELISRSRAHSSPDTQPRLNAQAGK